MSRPVFSFRPNLENPEHKQAWDILHSVPEGKKNSFLVRAILEADSREYLEKTIRQAVREELKCGGTAHSGKAQEEGEIPDQMLDFLGSL